MQTFQKIDPYVMTSVAGTPLSMPIITSRNYIIKRFHWSMNQRLFSIATSHSVAIVKFENMYDSKCSNNKKWITI
mgnify:CR=1 FL=1